MDKKGILGLDTVKAVMLVLLTLAILVITSFVILGYLQTSVETADLSNGAVFNKSTATVVNGTGAYVTGTTPTIYRNCLLSITSTTSPNGSVIASSDYSITGCLIKAPEVNATYNNTIWYVNGTFTYDQPYTNNVVGNITTGSTNFFAQVPTFFVLLGVVVLILIIAIVIIAISRFREEGSAEQFG